MNNGKNGHNGIISPRKFRVVSLFTGCGGLDLGFRGNFDFLGDHYPANNFEIVWANDIDEKSCQTYRNNFGTDHIVCGDFTEIAKNPNSVPDCDIILGGFPCQDFSVAGKRRGFETKRGKLYLSMKALVLAKKPVAFIAENVRGLLNIGKGEVIKVIENDFKDAGYKISINLFNAADYGVPETRERVIIVGIRNDISEMGINFVPPQQVRQKNPDMFTKAWVTAKEALDDLKKHNEGELANHYWSKAKLFPGTQGNVKIKADRPGPTMRAEHHGNIEYHYELPRRLSAREAARIQSFPDDFVFHKSTSDAYRQIGNAVAPVFGWHLANALYNSLAKPKAKEQVDKPIVKTDFEYEEAVVQA